MKVQKTSCGFAIAIWLLLFACSPSPAAVQRAIQQTQEAAAAIATPTLNPDQQYAGMIESLKEKFSEFDSAEADWDNLMGQKVGIKLKYFNELTYSDMLYFLFLESYSYPDLWKIHYQQISSSNETVEIVDSKSDQAASLAFEIEVLMGSVNVPQAVMVSHKKVQECIRVRGKYYQLVNDLIVNGLPASPEEVSDAASHTIACKHYNESLQAIMEFSTNISQ